MDEVKMCGICLTMDLKMYKLRGCPLEDYYTRIIGSLLEANISHYFQYVCYECAYYIRKYNSFREKCLRSQSVLFEMLQEKGKITGSDIKSVDRVKLQLCSNLTYYSNNHKIEYTDIKEECNIKDFSEVVEPGVIVEVNAIKVDYDLQEQEDDEGMTSELNDDEHSSTSPTEKRKTSKRQATKKKSRKVIKKPLKKRRQNENLKKITKKKTTRKKTLKSKLDSKQNPNGLTASETTLTDRVEIIKLTVEEQIKAMMKKKDSSNYINSEYKCNLCYKGFTDPDAFNYHMKRHDPGNARHTCPICKLCFHTNVGLHNHRRQHEKIYICKACSRVCITTSQAKLHQNEHDGKTYKCEHCDYITTKWTSRLNHMRLKHPSDFVCDICGFSFVSELGLKSHKSRHRFESEPENSNIKTIRYCEPCDVHCNSQQMWKSHMTSIAHKIKTNNDLTCDKCNETFMTDDELRSHHRRLHPRRHGQYKKNKSVPKVWPSKCPHCDEIISTTRKYHFHLRKSHPDKPYPITKNHICDICGKRFMVNALLQDHKRTHFEDKPFKCSQCPKSFYKKVNLEEHQISHSDARPYACDICNKAFKTKGNMQRHLMVHTGERPYPCKYCGKGFSESSGCRVHIMTVHFKQPAPYKRRQKRRRAHLDDPEQSP